MNGSPSAADYELGQRIGALIAGQSVARTSIAPIISQVQDLLGADTSLLGPIRDLLSRPAYLQLLGWGQGSVLSAGRDGLLQDLSLTYHPAIVQRLAAVVDGSLGIPMGPLPASAIAAAAAPAHSGTANTWTPLSPGPSAPAPVPQQVLAAPAAGTNPLVVLLLTLISVLAGGVLMVLAWILFNSRSSLPTPAQLPSAPSQPAPSPQPPPPSPQPAPEQPKGRTEEPAPGAWGSASDYKFGRLPDSTYPNSCAFTVTDASNQTIADKSRLEYWACRDIGGSAENGYSVEWSDGKRTAYTFGSGGQGTVVGTNGSSYPISWRNDSHQGSNIIVIQHQDGAISWIPGHVQ